MRNTEARNRLATLDASADFSAVAMVRAGDVGPFTGHFLDTIVAPDRNNLAPRIGLAWPNTLLCERGTASITTRAQTAAGSSILHAGSIGLQKRLAQGLTFSASYIFSRSMDNVRGLGDETQAALDHRALYRERGLSVVTENATGLERKIRWKFSSEFRGPPTLLLEQR